MAGMEVDREDTEEAREGMAVDREVMEVAREAMEAVVDMAATELTNDEEEEYCKSKKLSFQEFQFPILTLMFSPLLLYVCV